MKTLTISKEEFGKMISDLVASGVTFEAITKDEKVIITFTGGY